MSIIAKSQALMRQLQDNLQLRLPSSYVFTAAQDTAGAQLLISQHYPAVAGEQNIAIRAIGQDQQFTDVIGNPQRTYSPMKFQVIEESSSISGVSLLTLLNRVSIDMELARPGVRQERWMNANGTVPALSEFNTDGSVSTASLILAIAPDLYWPLSGQ